MCGFLRALASLRVSTLLLTEFSDHPLMFHFSAFSKYNRSKNLSAIGLLPSTSVLSLPSRIPHDCIPCSVSRPFGSSSTNSIWWSTCSALPNPKAPLKRTKSASCCGLWLLLLAFLVTMCIFLLTKLTSTKLCALSASGNVHLFKVRSWALCALSENMPNLKPHEYHEMWSVLKNVRVPQQDFLFRYF